ncbi:hypothetical protein ATCV1_z642R [Acanthocystis turfacea chlorella virus 1]|uniref:Uncharacterized protein z642R n=1 Tax=Chlorovirus heliozoae TaxID=322019 RepID=A7K9Q2_9PHYC|nr:hypothetical protein ATCV1_z642R [Acanthocystis turfacea chlorella virus 1]ABT16776.1 hypothetical protein ATCV1_z642R [Acanthocystis turfacea chlorella virus 1]
MFLESFFDRADSLTDVTFVRRRCQSINETHSYDLQNHPCFIHKVCQYVINDELIINKHNFFFGLLLL